MIRLFDILFSLLGLIVLSPLFLIVAIWIVFDNYGPIFYRQQRVGKNGNDFLLLKFRSMRVGADKMSLITVGERDPRVTKAGYYLRKYKIDELPQLWNVLIGDMSLVGPRPEVRKYVDLYTEEQRKVLSIRPGITDYASIEYIDENRQLEQSSNPDKTYVEIIMPAKIALNMRYIEHQTLQEYFTILLLTFSKLFRH
ncbi:MAG: sugar transferase [Paludibacteraceae bacterium]|nr:sugar transferase [Paludibacteraceae bacterium]